MIRIMYISWKYSNTGLNLIRLTDDRAILRDDTETIRLITKLGYFK